METENTIANDKTIAEGQAKNKKSASKTEGDGENVESKANKQKEATEHSEGQSLKEVIRQNATEDDAPLSKNITLNKILGGDILTTTTVRRQIWVFLLIAFFTLVYISNRYSCQQDLIEIDKLQERLQDAKYKALSTSSQMTEKSRESNVLEMLRNNSDSTLKTPSQPPYIITIPEDN